MTPPHTHRRCQMWMRPCRHRCSRATPSTTTRTTRTTSSTRCSRRPPAARGLRLAARVARAGARRGAARLPAWALYSAPRVLLLCGTTTTLSFCSLRSISTSKFLSLFFSPAIRLLAEDWGFLGFPLFFREDSGNARSCIRRLKLLQGFEVQSPAPSSP
jgi:hypothetical protein